MRDWRRILRSYSTKEIYNGVQYTLMEKIGKRPVADYEKPYRLVATKKRSMPLRINSYIVNKFLSKEWTPKPQTIRKIMRFDYYAKYGQLRQAGANKADARSLAAQSWEGVDAAVENYNRYAGHIAASRDVPIEYVEWGMSVSDTQYEDYEEYTEGEET